MVLCYSKCDPCMQYCHHVTERQNSDPASDVLNQILHLSMNPGNQYEH